MYKILSVLSVFTVTVMCLSACGENTNQQAESQSSDQDPSLLRTAPTEQNLFAKIKGMPVRQDMIDERIKLKLFDLEWAKYELRRDELTHFVAGVLSGGQVLPEDVEVILEPPMPPRLEVNSEGQPSYGNPSAPVTVAIFCSYQSSHCARMQEVYQQLDEAYPSVLNFVFYDYPQRFHRYAQGASYAARCAQEGGQFWGFHKALWANQDNLNNDFYLRMAKQLNLSAEQFSECIEERRYLQQVKANFDLAEALGFGNVPVTLVNGLYLKGPKTIDTLRFYVDQELARLNLDADAFYQSPEAPVPVSDEQSTLRASDLPLRLEGVLGSSDPAQAKAMIRNLLDESSRDYRQDEQILPNVFLVVIEAERVVIENNGKLEFLTLLAGVVPDEMDAGDVSQASNEATGNAQNKGSSAWGDSRELPPDMPPADELDYTPRPVVAAKGELPLSRAWLEDQLLQQAELESHFKPAEHEVEGVHVLKLRDVQDNEFYQTLGLQDGDVVLRVNDEWVHEAQNNLFNKLETENEISVVLMRKGLPVHLKYAIN